MLWVRSNRNNHFKATIAGSHFLQSICYCLWIANENAYRFLWRIWAWRDSWSEYHQDSRVRPKAPSYSFGAVHSDSENQSLSLTCRRIPLYKPAVYPQPPAGKSKSSRPHPVQVKDLSNISRLRSNNRGLHEVQESSASFNLEKETEDTISETHCYIFMYNTAFYIHEFTWKCTGRVSFYLFYFMLIICTRLNIILKIVRKWHLKNSIIQTTWKIKK